MPAYKALMSPLRLRNLTIRNRVFSAGRARNAGRIDLDALAEMRAQPECQDGDYLLFEIGDASVSRNLHAAIYDARRLCRVL